MFGISVSTNTRQKARYLGRTKYRMSPDIAIGKRKRKVASKKSGKGSWKRRRRDGAHSLTPEHRLDEVTRKKHRRHVKYMRDYLQCSSPRSRRRRLKFVLSIHPAFSHSFPSRGKATQPARPVSSRNPGSSILFPRCDESSRYARSVSVFTS